MPQSFQLLFARLAASAARAGLPLALLLTLTPVEAGQIVLEHREEREAWDGLHNHRTAAMLAMTANCHRRPGSRAYRAKDFLPRTDEDAEADFRAMAAFFGSEIHNQEGRN